MTRTPVQSSNIASIGYDEATQTLEVEFKGRSSTPNTLYKYEGVPKETHDKLMASHDVGKMFTSLVRNANYRYMRIS